MRSTASLNVLLTGDEPDSEYAIVYVERQDDGDGDRIAVFSGADRKRALSFAFRRAGEDEVVLVVADDDLSAWPEVLENFSYHAQSRSSQDGMTTWRRLSLRMCR